MTPSSDPAATVEALLAEGEWVRRLARSLVADPAAADDAVQETWLAAVARPGGDVAHPRAWLGTVLRRRLAFAARGGARRRRREEAAARPEAVPSTDELAARAEVHERVARAVLALEEPYRTTLLHRFVDDAPPREVARRMGVPVETVRTRTRRALERLRADLDPKDPRRRRALAAALVALAAAARGPAVAVPAVALGAGAVLAAGAVAAVLLARGVGGATDAAPTPDAPAAAARLAATPRTKAPAVAAAPAPEPARRGLLVRDAETGAPVPGARVVLLPRLDGSGVLEVLGGADGRAQVPLDDDAPRRVAVGALDHQGALLWLAPREDEARIVDLEPLRSLPVARTLAGRVTGPGDAPVEGAVVRSTDAAGRPLSTRTRADGSFLFAHAGGFGVGIAFAERAGVGRAAGVFPLLDGDPYQDRPSGPLALRLVPDVAVPLRIGGGPATAARLHVLPLSPALHGGGPFDLPVADGAVVRLPPGVWRAALSLGDDPAPVVEGVAFLASDGGLFALSAARDERRSGDLVPTVGRRIDAVAFEVVPGALRVRVLDAAGAPVVGAGVDVEPADVAKPFGRVYGEYGPSDPSWRSGLSGWSNVGDRAPLERLRRATTDAKGEAVVRGSLPTVALLRARGDFVPDAFREVAPAERAAGVCEVRVERGGSVAVEWPDWLARAVLARDDGRLVEASADDGPVAVPAGRWVLRVREVSWGGPVGKAAAGEAPRAAGSATEIVIAGPFDVRTGERTSLDLRRLAPRRSTVLRLPLAGTGPVTCTSLWGAAAPRPVRDGVVAMPALARGSDRFRFAWSEDASVGGATHLHDVNVSTEGAAETEPAFDLGYAARRRRLVVENRTGADAQLVAAVGREGEAPRLDVHRVLLAVPAGAVVEATLSNLPAGSWVLEGRGAMHVAATPETLVVAEDDAEPVRVVLEDLHRMLRFLAPDGTALPEPDAQRLFATMTPAEDPAARPWTAEGQATGAFFPRVPPGRAHLRIVDRWDPRAQGRPVSRVWFEGDVTVEPGVAEIPVTASGR